MASQPFKRAFLAQVKARGGWSVIFVRIASGETLAAIAKDYGCSRSWLSRLLNEDEQRRALLQIAKREGAAAHVEEALRLVDESPVERDALQKTRLQVEHRRWMAGVYDREQFGEAATTEVTLNIPQLHVEAMLLRHRAVTPFAPELAPLELPPPADDDGAGVTGRRS